MAEGLVSVVGESLVGKAYFNGEHGGSDAVLAAFNRTRQLFCLVSRLPKR
jgi:hypothetical protein